MSRVLLATVLAAAVPAQDRPDLATVEVPLPLRQDADAGLARIERSGQIVQLRIAPLGPIDSPMIEVPVVTPHQDWRFAATRDRRFLVGLAGGIRNDLELYLIDRQRARWLRFPTSGGRLLPDRFADGSGSWPQLQGAQVVLFAFARHERIELRVLDFEGRVLAAPPPLPETLGGIDYRFVPESFEIELGFRGAGAPLRVPHPLAPWLEIVESAVEFGDLLLAQPATRPLTVRNRGRSELRLGWDAPGAPFEVVGEPELTLAPDETRRLEVRFAPSEPGPAQALLRLTTNGPLRRTSVLLRGRAVVAPPAPQAAPEPERGGEPQTEPGPQHVPPAEPRVAVGRPVQPPAPAPEPPLRRAADEILVRCAPAQEFLLTALSGDGAGRMLAVWRGRTDSGGEWRTSLASIAGEGAPFDLVLLWHEQGRLQRSAPLRIEVER